MTVKHLQRVQGCHGGRQSAEHGVGGAAVGSAVMGYLGQHRGPRRVTIGAVQFQTPKACGAAGKYQRADSCRGTVADDREMVPGNGAERVTDFGGHHPWWTHEDEVGSSATA